MDANAKKAEHLEYGDILQSSVENLIRQTILSFKLYQRWSLIKQYQYLAINLNAKFSQHTTMEIYYDILNIAEEMQEKYKLTIKDRISLHNLRKQYTESLKSKKIKLDCMEHDLYIEHYASHYVKHNKRDTAILKDINIIREVLTYALLHKLCKIQVEKVKDNLSLEFCDVSNLIDLVCNIFGITSYYLLSPKRDDNVVMARMIISSILYNIHLISPNDIAVQIGRDRTSIYHYLRAVDNFLTYDCSQRDKIRNAISELIKGFYKDKSDIVLLLKQYYLKGN